MVITYEFPMNERIRTVLRLEKVFGRTCDYLAREHAHDHHAALLGMFEIVDITARSELKAELLQELERQRQTLMALRNNPHIREDALQHILLDIGQTQERLLNLPGKIGAHIRDSEWLSTLKQRAAIPGGVCEFDLPRYHYWLAQDSATRRADLTGWLAPFMPINDAVRIMLQLLRNSAQSMPHVAVNGVFLQSPVEKKTQLLQVSVPGDAQAIPELSANRHAINIRFNCTGLERTRITDRDIGFTLTHCCF